MQNKITKTIFHFSLILETFKRKEKKKKKGYLTQKQISSEKRGKGERKGRKKKEKIK